MLIDSTVVNLHAGMPRGSRSAVLHAEHAEEEGGGERRKSEREGERIRQNQSSNNIITTLVTSPTLFESYQYAFMLLIVKSESAPCREAAETLRYIELALRVEGRLGSEHVQTLIREIIAEGHIPVVQTVIGSPKPGIRSFTTTVSAKNITPPESPKP